MSQDPNRIDPHQEPQRSSYTPASPVKRTLAWIGLVYVLIFLGLTTYFYFTGTMLGNLGPLLAVPGLIGLGILVLVGWRSVGKPGKWAAIALAGSSASDEAPDPMFILSCIGIVAFAFAVITGLMLASLRTIAAICRAWIPARIIVGIVCVLELLNILQSVTIWLWDPSRILMDVTLDLLGLAFGILFLLLGLRVLFWIYCMITGKDDEAITAREIAANDRKKRF